MDYESQDLEFLSNWLKLQPVLAEIEDLEYLKFLEDYEMQTRRRYMIVERIVGRRHKLENQKYMRSIWRQIYEA